MILYYVEISLHWGSEFPSDKIKIRNQVTQNDVTYRVTNPNIFTEILLSSYLFEKWKNKILISKSLEVSLLKWNFIQFRLIWYNVDMLDFVILDVALNRCCLLWRNYSAHVLRYTNFFLTLDIRLFYMRYLYKYWDSVSWCKFMDMSIYKIAEDHSQ